MIEVVLCALTESIIEVNLFVGVFLCADIFAHGCAVACESAIGARY